MEFVKSIRGYQGSCSEMMLISAHDRFAKDLEVATQLMRCNDPSEAFKLQAEFANELAGDYLTESRKMFEWVSHLVATDQVKARQSGSGRQHAR